MKALSGHRSLEVRAKQGLGFVLTPRTPPPVPHITYLIYANICYSSSSTRILFLVILFFLFLLFSSASFTPCFILFSFLFFSSLPFLCHLSLIIPLCLLYHTASFPSSPSPTHQLSFPHRITPFSITVHTPVPTKGLPPHHPHQNTHW